MPASVAEFVQAVQDSGILTPETLAEYTQDVAPETDATSLANRLVKAGRLSAFQAKYIYGGKAKSLLLGPYVVLDVLGKGGMGYVYKAEHRRMRRMVALKVISRAALKSPDAVRRFEREVQAAARLEHPNIVTAFDAGEASGTHYLVMQYVDGRNLSEVVKELGPQPVGRTVDWILQAARGLGFAHEHGVIHRDIKPGNLLVDSRGTVKILDMGLARLETLDADQDQLTGTGQIMGTVDYMAPEQAVDTRQADARSDVYSLGVTLWYLLTGRPLFAGDTAMSKMLAHMQNSVPQLASVRGDVAPEVEAVFQRMVAKKPADRFQTMQEVIGALEALPQGTSTPGSPCVLLGDGPASIGSSGIAATQTLQKQKAAAADENTTRLSAVVVDTQTGLENNKSATERRSLSLKPRHLAIGGGAVGALVLIGLIAFVFSGRRNAESRGGPSDESVPRPGSVAIVPAPEATSSPQPAKGSMPGSIPSPTTAQSPTAPPPAIAPFDATQARGHQEAWAKHLGIPVESTNSIGASLVVIPPGKFTMGGDGPGEGGRTIAVTLTKPFLIGRTELTQGQWREVMGTEPWKGTPNNLERSDVAATHVSWHDAVAFCDALTARERDTGAIGPDQQYRLPTEAEWEFACRAGTVTRYSFGDDEALLGTHAWFGDENGKFPGGNTSTEMHAHPVGLKLPNPWGLCDIHGNVWEWTLDWLGDYATTGVTDPEGPAAGLDGCRVIRGGGWWHGAAGCKCGHRGRSVPQLGDSGRGFRIVLCGSGPDLKGRGRQDGSSPFTPRGGSGSESPPPAVALFDSAQARKHQENWAQHLGMQVATTNSIGQTLVVIPPGRFTMGEGDSTVDVSLTKPFLLGQTEVTQGQWKAVMGTEPWKGRNYKTEGADVAVTWVSWHDAVAFCKTLTDQERSRGALATDQEYRLPTEAEWEFACRAGTNTLYFFGNDATLLGEYEWFGGGRQNSDRQLVPGGNTASEMFAHAVRLKRPNPWQLFDIYGNAGEWVSDMFGPLPTGAVVDPKGAAKHTDRVRRGLGWSYAPRDCRSASRVGNGPQMINDSLGFRLALSPPRSRQSTTQIVAAATPSSSPPPAIAPFDPAQARKHQETWAKHLGIQVESVNSIGLTLVVIPPGRFTMGEGDKTVDVTLTKPFLFGQTEVTRGQWRGVMASEPWKGKENGAEGDDVAASNISLPDAETFCLKLTERERSDGRLTRAQAYRLPIAAEWEYACRAGTQTTYSFGYDAGRLGDYAWFLDTEERSPATPLPSGRATQERHVHSVGKKKPGPWGLFDMHGNVWERCQAWSAEHPQTIVESREPLLAGTRHAADAMGGCFRSDAVDCRSAVRFAYTASGRPGDIGLRIVLSVPAATNP